MDGDLRWLVETSDATAHLDHAERAVIAAVLTGHLSWSPIASAPEEQAGLVKLLRRRLKLPRAVAEAWASGLLAVGHDTATIERLMRTAWLERWTVVGGSYVTLTPWAAERLGVELADPRDDGLTHWDTPEPRKRIPVRVKKIQAATDELDLFGAVDPAPGPAQEAEDAEEYLMIQRVDPESGKALIDLNTGVPVMAKMLLWGRPIAVEKPAQRKVNHRARAKGKKSKKGKCKKVEAT
jgi:hypothetical protein